MSELMQASHQWATRPDDERFTSLIAMQAHFDVIRRQSREIVVGSRRIEATPNPDNKGLSITGPNGHAYDPTNWAFGQVAQLAEAPAGYLRTLPSPIAADCINYGLKYKRNIEDVGVLLQKSEFPAEGWTATTPMRGEHTLRAATGPRYGRIWNADILQGLVKRFGDGITGDWRVPGEFGKAVTVDKANTTLYAGDRDMFIFLADEEHRIEVPNRRNGQAGQMARGFFMWNSEVGSSTFGLGTFLFDYVCMNRIVWGAEQYQEIKIRHTASAPDRWLEELEPALTTYANASDKGIVQAITDARAARLDDVGDFLSKRFGKRMASPIMAVHMLEEQRPIETLWDAATAATAYARSVKWQDQRVEIERTAGDLLKIAA